MALGSSNVDASVSLVQGASRAHSRSILLKIKKSEAGSRLGNRHRVARTSEDARAYTFTASSFAA
jgi:hypothetical protein